MKYLIVIGLSALLAGCVSVTMLTGPDGGPAYSMHCPNRQQCLVKAGEICPGGYRIVDDSMSIGGVVITQYAAFPVKQDYLTISCR
jgi:uncharacterized protein YceK